MNLLIKLIYYFVIYIKRRTVMEKQEYYLGLDMGISSVGWAVTNTKYEILRKKGKDMWGIREFEEADSSAERRTHRMNRRRRQHQVARMGLLKESL